MGGGERDDGHMVKNDGICWVIEGSVGYIWWPIQNGILLVGEKFAWSRSCYRSTWGVDDVDGWWKPRFGTGVGPVLTRWFIMNPKFWL